MGEREAAACGDRRLGLYPSVWASRGVVRAEFVVLPIADWPAIDRLENHPHLYTRRQIEARLPDGSSEVGWVYVMNKLPARARVMAGGDWTRRSGNNYIKD